MLLFYASQEVYTKFGIVSTNSKHSYPVTPNLLKCSCAADRPNAVWVGAITYLPTDQGRLYPAIVKDLCSRKVVCYTFSDRIDARPATQALEMAVRREKPTENLVFHSDRGVQYASHTYRQAMEIYSICQGMSRKGDPYDNAVAENFFCCLKCELIYLRRFSTRDEAQAAVFAYIEAFYNRLRPHSGIGWCSPNDFASSFLSNSAA